MSFSLEDLNPFKVIIDKVLSFIPDPQKKAELQLEAQKEFDANSQALLATLAQIDKAQTDTNTAEAQSNDKFVSRARPAAMWVCVFGLAWGAVLQPILGCVLVMMKHPEMVSQLPPIDVHTLMTILGYMLGYGGIRTFEKIRGIAS